MKTNQLIDDSLIPIVIGVTGHRDLRQDDIAELGQKIHEIFREIKRKCPNSPIILLSPLAEGADRLVAKTALELGLSIVAPLPMPIDEYMKDFKDQVSQAEFSEILRKSTRYFEMPLVEGNTLENTAEPGEHRDRQYSQIGAYIAKHSQILIALWDGIESKKTGGTASIVGFKLKGIPEPYAKTHHLLIQVESGPVYHIVTPRISSPGPIGGAFTVRKIYPEYWGDELSAKSAYDQMLKHVDNYNLDVKRLALKLLSRVNESKSYLFPDQADVLRPDCETTINRYSFADVMAQVFKARRFTTILLLFLAVLSGFLLFETYLEFCRSIFILSLYPILVLFAFVLYLTKGKRYEYKHEDYRALAEALRVQFFWKLTGVDEEVADHYLQKHKGELEWIRYAIRAWSIQACGELLANASSYELGLKYWVNDQRDYFKRRCREDRKKLDRYHRWSKILLILGWSVAGVFLLHEIFLPFWVRMEILSPSAYHGVIFSIITFLAVATAIQGYTEKTVLSEESKQYEVMAKLYILASEKLSRSLRNDDLNATKQLFREIGKEALIENGDWLLLHRARPLDVPIVEPKPKL
jgi:hypothetical protein